MQISPPYQGGAGGGYGRRVRYRNSERQYLAFSTENQGQAGQQRRGEWDDLSTREAGSFSWGRAQRAAPLTDDLHAAHWAGTR